MKKNLIHSIDLPRSEQFGENHGWEDGYQRYLLDTEILEEDYFSCMIGDDLIRVVRKMDNFLRERGISDCFMRNYYLACKAFHEMDERSSHSEEDEY